MSSTRLYQTESKNPNSVTQFIKPTTKKWVIENYNVKDFTFNFLFKSGVINALSDRYVIMCDNISNYPEKNRLINLETNVVTTFSQGQPREYIMPENWLVFGRFADLRYVNLNEYVGENIRDLRLQHPQKIYFTGTGSYALNAEGIEENFNVFRNEIYAYGNPNNTLGAMGSITYPSQEQMLFAVFSNNCYELWHLSADNKLLLPLVEINNHSDNTEAHLDLSPNADFLTSISWKNTNEKKYIFLYNLKPLYAAENINVNFEPDKRIEISPEYSVRSSNRPYHWVSSSELLFLNSTNQLQCYNPYTEEVNQVLNNLPNNITPNFTAFNFLPNGNILTYNQSDINHQNFYIFNPDEYNRESFAKLETELLTKNYLNFPNVLVNIVVNYVFDPRLFALRNLPKTLADHQGSLARRIRLGELNLQEEKEESKTNTNQYYEAMLKQFKTEQEIVNYLAEQVKHYNQGDRTSVGATMTYQDCIKITLEKFPNATDFVSLHKYLQPEMYIENNQTHLPNLKR